MDVSTFLVNPKFPDVNLWPTLSKIMANLQSPQTPTEEI